MATLGDRPPFRKVTLFSDPALDFSSPKRPKTLLWLLIVCRLTVRFQVIRICRLRSRLRLYSSLSVTRQRRKEIGVVIFSEAALVWVYQ